jgi:hypothetical protein
VDLWGEKNTVISFALNDRLWPADRWAQFKVAIADQGATLFFDAKPHGDEVRVRNALVSYDRTTAMTRQGARKDINEVQHEKNLRGICRTYGAEPLGPEPL